MLGTMSVQDLDETDWAPAGWEPQDVSALDDSPFGPRHQHLPQETPQ